MKKLDHPNCHHLIGSKTSMPDIVSAVCVGKREGETGFGRRGEGGVGQRGSVVECACTYLHMYMHTHRYKHIQIHIYI